MVSQWVTFLAGGWGRRVEGAEARRCECGGVDKKKMSHRGVNKMVRSTDQLEASLGRPLSASLPRARNPVARASLPRARNPVDRSFCQAHHASSVGPCQPRFPVLATPWPERAVASPCSQPRGPQLLSSPPRLLGRPLSASLPRARNPVARASLTPAQAVGNTLALCIRRRRLG